MSAHNARRYMATTQLAMGRSPLDVQRQMGHTTLTMTNHYASLPVQHLQKSHEKYSPLRAEKVVQKRYLVRVIGQSSKMLSIRTALRSILDLRSYNK